MKQYAAYFAILLLFFCGVINCYSEEMPEDTHDQSSSKSEEGQSDQDQNEQEIEDLKEQYEKKVVEELSGKKLAQFKAMKKFVERNLALKNAGVDFETRKTTLAMEFGL
jgi:hypothetical protein